MDFETDIIISLISRVRDKANRFIMTELNRHGLDELAPVHGDILVALYQHGDPTMKELAQIVDRKKSSVTTLVDKLIRLGYADKIQDAEDMRSYRISLTEEGKALKPILLQIADRLIEKVYKDVPRDERRQLVKSLNKINNGW